MGFRKLSDRAILGKSQIYYSATAAKLLGYDPSSIFGTDLVAWYKADTVVASTTAINKVSQWTDKSGNNNHAFQSNDTSSPLLVLNGFNNKPVIRFGQDVWLNLPNFLSSNWGEASLFIIYNLRDTALNWNAAHTGSAGDSYWGTNSAFGFTGYLGEFRNARLEGQPANMSVAGQHFLEIVSGVGSNTYKVFRNSINLLTTNPSWGVTSVPYIGRHNGVERPRYMNGDIAEIFIVKKAASDAQRQQAQEYVKGFWNLNF